MLTELSGGITVQITIKTIALFTATAISSSAISSSAQAAPMSMLQSISNTAQAPANQPTTQAAPSKMGWLTKWMGNKPSDAVNPALQAPAASTQAGAQYQHAGPQYPQMAYVPPQASERPVSNIIPREMVSAPSFVKEPVAIKTMTANPTQVATARTLREQGHEADRVGTLGEAERLYRLAMEADPTSAAVVNDLALCLARQGQLDKSASTFLQAISMRPEKPLYRNNIATVLVEMGLYDDAKSHLMAAYPPATASYNLGHLLVNRGNQEKAIAAFQEALAYDPNLAAANEMLASLSPAPANISMTPHVAQVTPLTGHVSTYSTNVDPSAQTMPTSATSSFPRLLPPVINR